jgi:type I restriction enzyme S subunit
MQDLLTGKRRLPGCEGPWITRPFGNIASTSRERVNPSAMVSPPRCIELEHLQSGSGRLIGTGFESQQAATKSVFRRGDVLFGKLRAYLRKYWLADFDGVCSTEIWVLRPKGELASSQYLFYTVQRDEFIEAASTAYGTHMPRSDWKVVAECDVPLPQAPSEQEAISQVLSDMDAEIEAVESRLIKARALKQAMAQALLTGRIRLVPTQV